MAQNVHQKAQNGDAAGLLDGNFLDLLTSDYDRLCDNPNPGVQLSP
jgi:hypothetical protein